MSIRKKLPVAMCISRSSGPSGHQMHVQVIDDTSGSIVLDAYFELDQMMSAISASYGYGEGEWMTDNIGKVREVKTVSGVTHDNLHDLEVDGWKARSSDIGNSHRGNPTNGYSVTFIRFVDSEESQP